ncbi:hypothetical protein HPB47_027694 [Ixodes persulcatus]|uniref:Uncharacterized protein n=1 Tax=Ixodes persulcatus TaxID=34615 RepID=A0AC60PVS0_IXOPE|nr:hypothetical protein HPB47_027694 [Ixodes persulcatus]
MVNVRVCHWLGPRLLCVFLQITVLRVTLVNSVAVGKSKAESGLFRCCHGDGSFWLEGSLYLFSEDLGDENRDLAMEGRRSSRGDGQTLVGLYVPLLFRGFSPRACTPFTPQLTVRWKLRARSTSRDPEGALRKWH